MTTELITEPTAPSSTRHRLAHGRPATVSIRPLDVDATPPESTNGSPIRAPTIG